MIDLLIAAFYIFPNCAVSLQDALRVFGQAGYIVYGIYPSTVNPKCAFCIHGGIAGDFYNVLCHTGLFRLRSAFLPAPLPQRAILL